MVQRLAIATVLLTALPVPEAAAQKPAAGPQERHVESLPHSTYFVIAPRQPAAKGKRTRLLVVLPGGDGSREFLPFVENGIAAQAPDDCLIALVTAVRWRDDQEIVWPTAKTPVPGMEYPTEKYVGAVVEQLTQEFAVDPAQRAVLAWSSSGPAVYLLLAAADGPFARGYVAMSIWPQDLLPAELAGAKGRRLVIDQSPEDQVTRFHHARKAYDALSVAGAIVRVSTYSGGHGWHDQPLPRLRAGLQWLFGEQQAPAPKWPAAPKAGANLLGNGGFEQGLDGWRAIDNSKRLQVEVTKAEHKEGKQALHLAKSGAMPLDLVVQDIELPAGGTLTCTASIKSKAAKNAWIKVWIYDQDGNALRDDVDLARVPADGDWQRVEKAWPCAGAVRATVQIVMVMGGDVWVDDVTLSVAK